MSTSRQFISLLLLTICTAVTAQSGTLDSSFSGDGLAHVDGGANGLDLGYAGALDPDGKILIAGWTNATPKASVLIGRYLPDGTPDDLFGQNGKVIAGLSGLSCRGSALILQPDGKILVAGSADDGVNYDFLVLRLLPDGTPDSTFSEDGWAIIDFGTTYELANAIVVQADGRILVAGRKAEDFFADFAMVRLLADGQPDPAFGEQGLVGTDFREEDVANDIIVQEDGKIILGGFSSVSANGDFALARYNPDGSLDKLFGTGGKVLTDLADQNQSDYMTSMMLLPDGKILTAGNANNNNLEFTSDAGIARYLPNGDLDASFGASGVVIAPFGSKTNIEGIATAADGKIILCGSSDVAQGTNRWFLSRFHPEGGLDISFGTLGVVTTALPGTNAFAGDVFVQPDSKIVAVGSSGASPDVNMTVARYIADFKMDFTSIPVSCPGSADGQIFIDVTGGNPPILYSIDGGVSFQESNVFEDLLPGTYVILVQDNDGTGQSGSIGPIVVEDAPAPPPVTVDVLDQTITITVGDGGIPPFSYAIDGGPLMTDPVFTEVPVGEHHVLVIDGNGCVITDTTVVVQLSAVVDPSFTFMSVSPNPSQGKFNMAIKDGFSEFNHVVVTDMTGRIVFKTAMHQGSGIQAELDLQQLNTGSYLLHVYGDQKHAVAKLMIVQ